MSWITTIPYENAGAVLRKLYDRVRGPNGKIDNILAVHSLRPHTLSGHMTLYKNVLHNRNNTLPKWYLETIGTYVSHLNRCTYCVDHHFAGLKRLLDDDEKAYNIEKGIKNESLTSVLSGRYGKAIDYIYKLTLSPTSIQKDMVEELKQYFDEGEILEINQVVSYFCYVNRTVLGLGVVTDGEVLGMSPSEDEDSENWNHS